MKVSETLAYFSRLVLAAQLALRDNNRPAVDVILITIRDMLIRRYPIALHTQN